MTDENVLGQNSIAIARLEARLDGISKQIDHQDRNSQQLVKLFEERITSRFDTVEKRLDMMEKARDDARSEAMRERELTESRLKELERVAADADTALEVRVGALERQWTRAVGIAVGASLGGGGVVGLILKTVGG